MGEVYKARHIHLDEIRIIKVTKPDPLGEGPEPRRFQEEARIATLIRHPERRGALRLLAAAGRLLLHGLGVHRRRHARGVAAPLRSAARPRARSTSRRRCSPDSRRSTRRGSSIATSRRTTSCCAKTGTAGSSPRSSTSGSPSGSPRRPFPDDGHGDVRRKAQVLLARTGGRASGGPGGRRPQRPLLVRHRSLRDADRQAAVRVPDAGGLPRQTSPRGSAAARHGADPGGDRVRASRRSSRGRSRSSGTAAFATRGNSRTPSPRWLRAAREARTWTRPRSFHAAAAGSDGSSAARSPSRQPRPLSRSSSTVRVRRIVPAAVPAPPSPDRRLRAVRRGPVADELVIQPRILEDVTPTARPSARPSPTRMPPTAVPTAAPLPVPAAVPPSRHPRPAGRSSCPASASSTPKKLRRMLDDWTSRPDRQARLPGGARRVHFEPVGPRESRRRSIGRDPQDASEVASRRLRYRVGLRSPAAGSRLRVRHARTCSCPSLRATRRWSAASSSSRRGCGEPQGPGKRRPTEGSESVHAPGSNARR